METLVAYLSRFYTADLAQSALPNAPVRPDPPRRRRLPRIRRR
jgi:hypothetical protein